MTYKKRNKNVQKTTKSNVSKNRSTRSVFKSNRTTLNTNIKQRQGIIGGNEVRVIGGTEVSPACGSNNNPNDDYGCKYPFMVHLEPRNSHELRCGASLIHPEWVLTAAHCMENADGYKWSDPNNSKVRLGVHNQFNIDLEEWTEVINVDFIIQHPNWENNRLNDIALLHLEAPSTFTPISLVTPPAGGFDYPQDVTLLGWGITEEIAPDSNVGSQSDVLLELETIYHPPGECILTDNGEDYYDGDRMMCIGNEIDNNVIDSACFGDSGGPAIMYNTQTIRDEVVGIISWGSSTCAVSWGDGTHSVSTRVEYYLPWIYNIIDTYSDFVGGSGDVNEDGTVNILDVVLLVNCILSDWMSVQCMHLYEQDIPAGMFHPLDLNQDGSINILDIMRLINQILVGRDISSSDRQLLQEQLDRLGGVSGRTTNGAFRNNVYTTTSAIAEIDSILYRHGGRDIYIPPAEELVIDPIDDDEWVDPPDDEWVAPPEDCNREALLKLRELINDLDGPLIDSISALEECFYDGRWNMRCLTGIGVATWAIADSGLIPILEEWWDDTMTTAFENWNVPTCESCGIGGSTDIGVCVGGSVCVTSALDVNYSDELGYGVAASFGFNFGTETNPNSPISDIQFEECEAGEEVDVWCAAARTHHDCLMQSNAYGLSNCCYWNELANPSVCSANFWEEDACSIDCSGFAHQQEYCKFFGCVWNRDGTCSDVEEEEGDTCLGFLTEAECPYDCIWNGFECQSPLTCPNGNTVAQCSECYPPAGPPDECGYCDGPGVGQYNGDWQSCNYVADLACEHEGIPANPCVCPDAILKRSCCCDDCAIESEGNGSPGTAGCDCCCKPVPKFFCSGNGCSPRYVGECCKFTETSCCDSGSCEGASMAEAGISMNCAMCNPEPPWPTDPDDPCAYDGCSYAGQCGIEECCTGGTSHDCCGYCTCTDFASQSGCSPPMDCAGVCGGAGVQISQGGQCPNNCGGYEDCHTDYMTVPCSDGINACWLSYHELNFCCGYPDSNPSYDCG